jgi:hypothetical protein
VLETKNLVGAKREDAVVTGGAWSYNSMVAATKNHLPGLTKRRIRPVRWREPFHRTLAEGRRRSTRAHQGVPGCRLLAEPAVETTTDSYLRLAEVLGVGANRLDESGRVPARHSST